MTQRMLSLVAAISVSAGLFVGPAEAASPNSAPTTKCQAHSEQGVEHQRKCDGVGGYHW